MLMLARARENSQILENTRQNARCLDSKIRAMLGLLVLELSIDPSLLILADIWGYMCWAHFGQSRRGLFT